MHRPRRTELATRISAALVCATAPAWALAQNQPTTELQSVTVTAQKRLQPMQQVPVAVTVVGAQEMENRGVAGFSELLALIPNVAIDQSSSAQPNISIRGISSSTNNIGIESGVGVVVDDVFLGRPSAFSTQLIDVERVEVLRGSQGTLFGKNTIGGLINIVTSLPSRKFNGAADVTVGSFGLKQARGFVTGALGENMAGKLSFTAKQRDGWVSNRTPGAEDMMSEDFKGLRAQLRGTPAPGLSWLLSAEYSKDDSVENYYDIRSGAFAAFDGNGADRSVGTNGKDGFKRTVDGVSLKLDGAWQGVDLVSITARRGVDWKGTNDQDYTELAIITQSRKEKQTQWSQEFRASARSGAFNWLAGLYLFSQQQDGVDNTTLDDGAPGVFGLPDIPGYQETADTIVRLKTRSTAVFGSGTFALSPQLDVNAGLRYTRESKTFRYVQQLDNPIGLIDALYANVAPFADSRRDAQWSGDLGLAYKLSSDINTYVKLTRGFKAGGFDTTAASTSDPGDRSFGAENVLAYEAGIKTILAGGKVRVNAAAFRMDYRDKQEQFFDGATQKVDNAAKAKVQGVELELTAKPTASLLLAASAGYQDARYKAYQDNTGNRLIDAPRLTASGSVQFEGHFSEGWGWMARADLRHRGMAFQQPDNDPLYTQEASTLLNLSMGLRDSSGRYSVLLWLKNATNKTYRTSTYEIGAFGTSYQQVNAPRMVGLEFRASL
ncbi:MAG: TonB-dependent receptor [Rubrivivax sp.]|nr:TonB-dependent receptor [Rubrivivax sp.]